MLVGLIGIEPITFRYERNILPLNYRNFFLIKKIAKKSYIKNINIRVIKQNCHQFKFIT